MSFLDGLAAATRAAEAAETAFRREVAVRMAALELERAFAFRRLNWMTAVVETVANAADEETATAHVRAALRARLGWDDDSDAHEAVLARFAPVAQAVFVGLTPAEPPEGEEIDVGAALAAFENWYDESHGRSFWALFEHHIPETPRVDF
jgi:hypothetical protein